MAERARRYPKRPVAFWAVFALTAALGLGVVTTLALKDTVIQLKVKTVP